jgi:DNA mismatch repair protein MutS
MAKEKISPMMQQYLDIKEQYKDCILFFRLGDFYEMFFDDAVTASRELELTLTGKSCGQEQKAPMCGVPFHSADTYIARLIEKGYKVAICEQTEDPATAKGIVKREVIRIVTPGTLTSQSMLRENENNYLASVYIDQNGAGISYCDISTGEMYASQLAGSMAEDSLINELVKTNAREVIINTESEAVCDALKTSDVFLNVLNENYYSFETAQKTILRQFNTGALTGLGLDDKYQCILSLGALLSYLLETQKQSLRQITGIRLYDIGNSMALDKATIRNLEITETLYDKQVRGSLLGVLDKTHTAMGSRKMKQWLREPLNRVDEITARLDAVESLVDNILIQNNIKDSLKRVYDFHRLAGRIASGNANGKDMIALRNSISVLPDIKDSLSDLDSELLASLNSRINPLKEVFDLIDRAVVEDPPFTIKEGGIIKKGCSRELDELKDSIYDAQQWIANLEGSERERTGIKNLKVGYNKVFGYYLEVTRSYYEMVPENYIRKQTLANAERYITPELKEMEGLVLNAEAKINKMEYELFSQLRGEIEKYIKTIQETSEAVAVLDVLTSFASVSSTNGYVKPEINSGDEIKIYKGRHPVIEQMAADGIFVSNDTYLSRTDSSMLLITGPNMSGKSTYMRQTAIIVLMAQAGCFVPCESAVIGIADRIFTRIGASDNLAHGQSTFFVEMSEMAYILNSATDRSLIILDEIGRGTSTYDGLSIAWATVEYLCRDDFRVRTLFATHYHELTALEEQIDGVANLNVDVAEENGNIVFLHKIVPGSASRSYGIHVAKLAGVPKQLLQNAEQRLLALEKNQTELMPETSHQTELREEEQLSLFSLAPDPVTEKLRNIDLMETTPSQAFKILEELKGILK